jgi:5'-AMP-activated protein kinase catalytic alpha subunit
MIAGKEYLGLNADIWSSGVILYAMVCGYLPFEDPKTSNLYKKIMNAEYTIPEDMITEDCKDLIQKFLTTNPEKRCTMKEIRAHPWYSKIKNQREYSGI